jgi:inorganic pyrophosphatase
LGGRYTKGVANIQNLRVAIENPQFTIRSGQSPDGKGWSNVLLWDYGEILTTEGADGDRIDCFIGPDPSCELVVVIDQIDQQTRQFDEH